jgi:hypothetical protein
MIASIKALRQRNWTRAAVLAARTVVILLAALIMRGPSAWHASASSYSEAIIGDGSSHPRRASLRYAANHGSCWADAES